MVIDFHTHSILSDGEYLPIELIRRASVAGYKAIGITDHVDSGNMERVIKETVKACDYANKYWGIVAIPGVEITHVPPEEISWLAKEARNIGAKLIIVHGETIVEPVYPGTNRAALESDIDILAHPGLLTEEEANLSAKRGIFLEISARKGHSLTNGHLVQVSRKVKAPLIIGSDTHSKDDLLSSALFEKIGIGAGLSQNELKECIANSETLLRRVK